MNTSSDVMKMMAYDSGKKSAGVAYLLWVFLGGLGVHRFYLGYTTSAIILLLLTLASLLTMGLTLVISGLWLLMDLFIIPSLTRQKNEELIRALA